MFIGGTDWKMGRCGGGIEIGCFVEGRGKGVEFSRGETERGRDAMVRWPRSFAECVNSVKWPGNEEPIGRERRRGGGWSKLPQPRPTGPVRETITEIAENNTKMSFQMSEVT